jgi:Glycosyl hydrolase family 12
MGLGNWNVTAATGTMSASYNPKTGASWTVDFTSENAAIDGVNAYPFINYGGSYAGPAPADQGVTFPELLSNMSSLVVDVNYSMNCVACGAFYDVMFDLWLVPNPTFASPSSTTGAQEVSIFDFNSAAQCWDPILTTLNQTIMVNGIATPITWDFCKNGTQLVVIPEGSPGYVSGDISFDQMPILNIAASLTQTTGWYLAGHEIGTEFQATGGALNFTFNMTKYSITQTLK